MRCWSTQKDYSPLAVSKTEGCWIHTTDGRRIFDLRSAHECINLGFNHPKVLQAMREQMEQVVYVTDDFATRPTAELARKLAELSPGSPGKRVFFSQSGAAAVEAAIKGARLYQYNSVLKDRRIEVDAPQQYPYPYKIVSRYSSWHGATASAASASGDPRRWFQEPFTVPGVVFAPEANSYRSSFGTGAEWVKVNLDYLEHLIEQEGGNNKVAAILFEPVVGSNGIIPPPAGYLEGLSDLAKRWGLLLIADETMCGMGRTGKLFAVEHWGIDPDIVVLGKALGAYCPLAATIFSEEISKNFEDNIFGHGQSYSGHALGCAAALESLRVLLEEGVLDNCVKMGSVLGDELHALKKKHPSVGDVRGLGLFWTIELVQDRKSKKPVRRITEKYTSTLVNDVSRFLFAKWNVYIPSDKFGIWIVPPLIVSREEIDFLISAIDASLGYADDLMAEQAL